MNSMAENTVLAEKHVLIVDDSAANVELLQMLLDEHGFERVTGLCDARQVLEYCSRHPVDLILLDIRMPYLDGFQVLEQLEDRFGERSPAVIVLTAQLDDRTRRLALDRGVRDFVGKPFKQDEVVQRLRNALIVQHRYQCRDRRANELELLVAERTRALKHQALSDDITGLPNRRGLLRHLDTLCRSPRSLGLLFIAVDGLEDIIRLHGHSTSEALLCRLGEAIAEVLDPATHYLGLWAGNELLVIQAEAPDEKSVETLARTLLTRIRRNHCVGGLSLPLDGRIGIHRAPCDTPERLVQMAAVALPRPGQGSIQRYTPTLEAVQKRRLYLQQTLRGAVERGEFSLYYQPKVDLTDGRTRGVEALLRWQHPELGWVSPETFIPLAEVSGDILPLGDWVIDTALAQASEWHARGLIDEDFDIAVNVSARQLVQDDFAARLLARLEHHDLSTRCFSVEVTESDLLADIDKARSQLAALFGAGVGIAIDDFGTGYSSLAYLQALPVSLLKIDRVFVQGLESNPHNRHLVKTMIVLARDLGCGIVAEGIEAREQAALLVELGCELGQGHFYSAAQAKEEFIAWYQAS